MSGELVRVEQEGSVAVLTLDNPPLNLISVAMTSALNDVLSRLSRDRGVRALVVTGGEAAAFCAGSDIKEFRAFMEEGGEVRKLKLEPENDMYDRLAAFPAPTIAALNGNALGGGLELAVCCDLLVCSEDARLGLPEVRLGVFPGSGGTHRVPRRVGMSRAAELVLLGEPISAATALAWGLVNRVVPKEETLDAAAELAEKIARRSPTGVMLAKRALSEAFAPSGAEARDTFLPLIEAAFGGADIREGTRAFFAKEEPLFEERGEE